MRYRYAAQTYIPETGWIPTAFLTGEVEHLSPMESDTEEDVYWEHDEPSPETPATQRALDRWRTFHEQGKRLGNGTSRNWIRRPFLRL